MASPANGRASGYADTTYDIVASLPEDDAPIDDDDSARDELDLDLRFAEALDGTAYASVGEWLSARRNALGLTLEDVEACTRVSEDYLAAIEDMDARRMPSGPYAPGFVRTYALYLDLDPEAVAARFREELSPRRLRVAPTTPAKETRRRIEAIEVPPRAWAILAVVGVAAALVAYGLRPRVEDDINRIPAVPEGLEEWAHADVVRRAPALEVVDGPAIALRARVPVAIEARDAAGETLVARELEAGETWSMPSRGGIVVDAENAAAVEVLFDGAPAGRLAATEGPVTGWEADGAREDGVAALAPLADAEVEVAGPEPTEPPAAEAVAAEEASDESSEVAADDAENTEEADGTALLDALIAEETLVSPELPDQPAIVATPLPDLSADAAGYVPDPVETAASEGPLVDPGADAPADE
jgi:transcriptional regulator with XRE-family HTH domain